MSGQQQVVTVNAAEESDVGKVRQNQIGLAAPMRLREGRRCERGQAQRALRNRVNSGRPTRAAIAEKRETLEL